MFIMWKSIFSMVVCASKQDGLVLATLWYLFSFFPLCLPTCWKRQQIRHVQIDGLPRTLVLKLAFIGQPVEIDPCLWNQLITFLWRSIPDLLVKNDSFTNSPIFNSKFTRFQKWPQQIGHHLWMFLFLTPSLSKSDYIIYGWYLINDPPLILA